MLATTADHQRTWGNIRATASHVLRSSMASLPPEYLMFTCSNPACRERQPIATECRRCGRSVHPCRMGITNEARGRLNWLLDQERDMLKRMAIGTEGNERVLT